MARLQVGAADAMLGTPASTLAGHIVPLAELWGQAATERLSARLTGVGMASAAAALESALVERFTAAGGRHAHARLAAAAAERLATANLTVVAAELGVSERHLRRVFQATVGVSPKAFAKLARFQRALHAANRGTPANWASIAVAAGYYDQAHLIGEFRAIAGVTPPALLGELRRAPSLGD